MATAAVSVATIGAAYSANKGAAVNAAGASFEALTGALKGMR